MNSHNTTSSAQKGDLFCRRAVWTDVAKFFALNIFLHGLTVVLPPGSTLTKRTLGMFCALLAPFSGLAWGIERIIYSTSHSKNKVEDAHRADALCMLVPVNYWPGFVFHGEIHGEYPNQSLPQRSWLRNFLTSRKGRSERLRAEPRWKPIEVPFYFTVTPTQGRDQNDTHLACNYNFIKGLAAIFQICYGSYELYDSRARQFQKYGFASYSVIVIPYILMSFLNLVSSLCQRDYPAAYLVIYRGPERTDEAPIVHTPINVSPPNLPPTTISPSDPTTTEGVPLATPPSITPQVSAVPTGTSNTSPASLELSHGIYPASIAAPDSPRHGDIDPSRPSRITEQRSGNCQWIMDIHDNVSGAVGYAYGPLEPNRRDISATGKVRGFMDRQNLTIGTCTIMLAVPYIVIYALTGFRHAQSSQWERFWILSSIVLGQVIWVLLWSLDALLSMVYPQASDPAITPPAFLPRLGIVVGGASLEIWLIMYGALMSVPLLVSFTVVGRMILEDDICTRA